MAKIPCKACGATIDSTDNYCRVCGEELEHPIWRVASCSGGKDSVAMVLRLWEEGVPLDEVVGVNEGHWWPEAVEAFERLRTLTGYNCVLLEPDARHNFNYLMFEHELTKGDHAGTKGYGWPTTRRRWCTSNCKIRVIRKHYKPLLDAGYEIHQYVGLAADEAFRVDRDQGDDNRNTVMHYPLVEWGMTEKDCLQYCYDHGIDWGGLYNHFSRMSCWCCPLQGLESLWSIYEYYPERWKMLEDMDRRAWNQFRPDMSVAQLTERFSTEGRPKERKPRKRPERKGQ